MYQTKNIIDIINRQDGGRLALQQKKIKFENI